MCAVMHFNKLKTMGRVSSRGAHNERTRDTPNADGGTHSVRRTSGSPRCKISHKMRRVAPTLRPSATACSHVPSRALPHT